METSSHSKDDAHKRELFGTVVTSTAVLGARLGGAVANFFFAILLARYLAPAEVGVVFLLMSMAMLAALLVTLNIETGAVRHLLQPAAREEYALAAGYVATARQLVIRLSPLVVPGFIIIVTFMMWMRGSISPALAIAIWVTGLSIPVFAILRVGSLFGHAMSRVIASGLSWGLLRPLILLGFMAWLVAWGPEQRIDYVMAASLLACLIALAAQAVILRGCLGPLKSAVPDFKNKREWVETGILLSVSVLLFEYFQNVVIVAADFGLSEADVGRLAIALRFVGFLRMGIMAVNSSIAPKISTAFTHNKMAECQRLIIVSGHLKLWPMIVVTAGVWWLAPFLVGLFGADYATAAWALRLFALMPLATAIFGPSALILNIIGQQKDIFRISLIAVVAIALITPVAGFFFGLTGAAAAPVMVMIYWEVRLWFEVRRKTGLNGSVLGNFHPVSM